MGMLPAIAGWFERAPSRWYGYLLLLPLVTVPLTMGLALWLQTGPPALHIDPADGRYLYDPMWPVVLTPGLLNLLPWLALLHRKALSRRGRFHARLAGALGALRLVIPFGVWVLATPGPEMTACPNLQPCALDAVLWATGLSAGLWLVTLVCWIVAVVGEPSSPLEPIQVDGDSARAGQGQPE